ncbi:MAG: virulence protein RhuM/Fic/DOC family protein [bacterium]|nr:virulence protein RhuM/Fic/DOC family protein [bacterium]
MKNNKILNNQIVIYQAKSGALEIKKDFQAKTVWATQAQIAEIFDIDRSVITKHIRNILSDKELRAGSVCAKFAHTGNDGKTYQVQFYNLDIILAVGYRTNSARAIEFRKWATKTLRSYILDGYAVNKNRISRNYQQFLEAVNDIRRLLPPGAAIDTDSVLELVSMFADTWLSLDAYDKDALVTKGATKKRVVLTAEKLIKNLDELKRILTDKGEASELFGLERGAGNIAGIVGNVMQAFGGRDLYESVEEKAAHLLYFMVKNHPYIDGNKRNGAYAFIWFLRQAKILDVARMTPPALTALTILVAESNPKEKDKMIHLILTLLMKKK